MQPGSLSGQSCYTYQVAFRARHGMDLCCWRISKSHRPANVGCDAAVSTVSKSSAGCSSDSPVALRFGCFLFGICSCSVQFPFVRSFHLQSQSTSHNAEQGQMCTSLLILAQSKPEHGERQKEIWSLWCCTIRHWQPHLISTYLIYIQYSIIIYINT